MSQSPSWSIQVLSFSSDDSGRDDAEEEGGRAEGLGKSFSCREINGAHREAVDADTEGPCSVAVADGGREPLFSKIEDPSSNNV